MSLAAAKLPEDAAAEEAAWIPICKAAVVMRLSVGHLRRQCTGRYRHSGLARKVGGSWQIHVRADQRLRSGNHQAQHDREVIAALAKAGVKSVHLDQAIVKRDIVRGLPEFKVHVRDARERIQAYIAHLRCTGEDLPRISVATLYRWIGAYERGGIGALVRADNQRGNEREGQAALAYIENIVNCGNKIRIQVAITMAQGEALKHPGDPGWKIASYSTIRVAIAARRPQILKVLADKGERAAKAQCIPKGHRDFEDLSTNQQWCGDERTLDVMVRVFSSRGWRAIRSVTITAWTDMRSRMLVGWIIEPHADSTTILGALKLGCRAHGLPTSLLVDWGKDYKKATGGPNVFLWKRHKRFDVQQVAGVLDELGIAVQPVLPYTPWSKPIESFFKTLKDRFDKFFASFWGGCPTERHEDRNKWVKNNLEKLPTLDELRKAFDTFADTYHRTPHGAVDMFRKTPLQAFEAFVGEDGLRRESHDSLDHLFMTFVGPKMVRRDGIKHLSRWFGHGDLRLVEMQGKKVLLGVHPDDASRATVCEYNDIRRPMFEIECLPLRGFTQREAADIAKQSARLLRPFRESAKRGRQVLLNSTPKQLLYQHAAGIEAVHGKGEPEKRTTPNLRIRPELQEAIATAGPAPSDAIEESSIAARTGTDDEKLNLTDFLECAPLPDIPFHNEDGDECMTLNDLIGEIDD